MLNKPEVIKELKRQKDLWKKLGIHNNMKELTIRGFICGYEFVHKQQFNEEDFNKIIESVRLYK